MDPVTVVAVGFMLTRYIVHRMTEEADPPRERVGIQIPRFEEGSVPPIFYGRVRLPMAVAWYGGMLETINVFSNKKYAGNVQFLIGIPFFDGVTTVHQIFCGDRRLTVGPGATAVTDLTPNIGGTKRSYANHLEVAGAAGGDPSFVEVKCEFADGVSTQSMIAGAGSHLATAMVSTGIAEEDIPGFRGYATLFATIVLGSSTIPTFGVEASTYPGAQLLAATKVGDECNPADVLYDLISGPNDDVGQLGKLHVRNAVLNIGFASFYAAAQTLLAEGNGYSRVIDSGMSADDIVQDICRQIDGVLYEDPNTGTFKLKLIRPDYDPRLIPEINVDNCEGLLDFAAAGWTSVVNKVRVVFPDRRLDYADGSSIAHNQANAVGQDGEVNELILHFPGVRTQALADAICARELAARSRPLAKFRAVVDRRLIDVSLGDAVSVTWPEANISGMVFRVVGESQGVADANIVMLDLLQDYSYVHRSAVIGVDDQVGAFPGSGGILAD